MDNQKKKRLIIIAAIVGAVVLLFFFFRGRMQLILPRADGATGTPGLTMSLPALGYTTYNIAPYQPATGGGNGFNVPMLSGASPLPCPCPKTCDPDQTLFADQNALFNANSGTLMNWFNNMIVS
jgi:hypothetical protein